MALIAQRCRWRGLIEFCVSNYINMLCMYVYYVLMYIVYNVRDVWYWYTHKILAYHCVDAEGEIKICLPEAPINIRKSW